MTLARCLGSEAGNGVREFNFYSGNGVNYIFFVNMLFQGVFQNFGMRLIIQGEQFIECFFV